MSYIEMPKMSDTMTEGTVVKWHKSIGDTVNVGDVLAEIETDKAVMELEAFDAGKLEQIYVGEGAKVRIGEKLALLLASGESSPQNDGPANQVEKIESITVADRNPTLSSQAKIEPGKTVIPAPGERIKASPLARKIAGAKGVDLNTVQGSGPRGRIIARDLEATVTPSTALASVAVPIVPGGQGARRIPLSGMRKVIAERLLASKTKIPHFYLNLEVDAGELMHLRAQLNEHLEKTASGKFTINDFILKAVVAAATKVPRVNASFSGDAIIEYADVHLAVAVAIEDGLVTPVIRQAQKKSLREISEAVKDLATRSRTKKLKPEEYQGGTLTVSNLGSYGIDSFSAVINPPQAIILAIGAIVKKPVVNAQDQIVAGHRLAVGLSADHRVVDGAIGAQYLAEFRRLLENPIWMLI